VPCSKSGLLMSVLMRVLSQGHQYWMHCVHQAVTEMHRETIKVGGRPVEEVPRRHSTSRFLVGGTLKSKGQ
jgi:hypothetical protein